MKKLTTLRTSTYRILAVVVLIGLATACSEAKPEAPATPDSMGDVAETAGYTLKQSFDMSIEVTSPAFNRIRRIPKKHSCGTGSKTKGRTYQQNFSFGESFPNSSPPLEWTNVPKDTVSIVLIMDSNQVSGDPWSHWLMWNIPADATGLPEAVATTTQVSSIGPKTTQGSNDDNTIGYFGPCPEPVHVVDTSRSKPDLVKKYFFRIYAIDTELDLGPDTTKGQLLKAIDNHILGAGEIKGEFVAEVIKAS
jgi:Raf kinase inhibitor-like YbhB/YbcL family protein